MVDHPTSVFYPGLELHVFNSICWSSGGQERLLVIPKVTPGSRISGPRNTSKLISDIMYPYSCRECPVLTHSHPKIMSESPAHTKKV